jgi:tRNA dimethylallyltransferase
MKSAENTKTIIFLTGPTAVGKTAVSLHMAKALNAEIISCDSMQIYKYMDIGTQKPNHKQQGKIQHHMISCISPSKGFSVADFRKRALRCIRAIEKKGKRVLFTGGTALYIKALVDGLFQSPPADHALRKRLLNQEGKEGQGYLYKKLCCVDMETAKLLHPNDTRRIIRALEVYATTKVPMSELKKGTKGLTEKYNIRIFCLNRDRQRLYDIIDKRVELMFRQGLVAECQRLKKKNLSMTARHALGYKEVFECIDKKMEISHAKESIKKQTRNFAKRQLSWFRNDKRMEWIDIDNKAPVEVARSIEKLLNPKPKT